MTFRVMSTTTPAISAMRMKPEPTARPIHAVHHSEPAVVRPEILCSDMKIVPAPRKPTPDTTVEVMRPTLTLIGAPAPRARTPAADCCSISAISAAPRQTSTCVRMPAGRFFISRSMPIIAPISTAAPMRRSSISAPSFMPNVENPLSNSMKSETVIDTASTSSFLQSPVILCVHA